MRLVLAIVAAIANAAGPWMCCCAVGAMLHASRTANAASPEPIQACSHCCNTAPADGSPSVPAQPAPTQPSPCQERQLSIAPTGQELSPVDAIAFDFAIPAAFAATALESTPAATRESERSFASPDTRQRVHHVMHC